jgi:hypothetical protein
MDDYVFEALADKTAADLMSPPRGIVRGGTSAWEVVERFLTGPARQLVLLDASGRYAGMIGTDRLAGLWPLDAKQLKSTPVESLGCASRAALAPEDGLAACVHALAEQHLDAVPVVGEDGRVLGVVTARGVTRAVADCAARRRHPAWQE